jgi:membrane protein YdbS with pleckstrin-like domain
VVVIALAYLLVMPRWRFRVHRWETTADAVYTSQGWINQEWRVAPMSRIQTVDTERGPLQQLFGLATVTVTTASAAGALRLAGLDRAVADDLVARLTETTQATPGDAT